MTRNGRTYGLFLYDGVNLTKDTKEDFKTIKRAAVLGSTEAEIDNIKLLTWKGNRKAEANTDLQKSKK
jgi:hypothetical protein